MPLKTTQASLENPYRKLTQPLRPALHAHAKARNKRTNSETARLELPLLNRTINGACSGKTNSPGCAEGRLAAPYPCVHG